MTYADAEQFLLSLSNLPRREYLKERGDLGRYTERMRRLLRCLGNPEKRVPHYIHVAGTSGKGSVATMIASIWQASGARTGLMISPPPTHLYERWQINGRPLSKTAVVHLVETLKPALTEYLRRWGEDAPSFFDAVTAMGFCVFAEKKVEWAVIEVGLGGKFDSTNVLPSKDAAVVTTIGLDHTAVLGRTRTKIAREKAGIIHRNCPVFVADTDPAVLSVIRTIATRTRVRSLQTIDRSSIRIHRHDLDGIHFSYRESSYRLPVLGSHQASNAALAIDVAHTLGIADSAVVRGLARTVLPLRMEIVSRHPLIILDGAHNPQKMQTTVDTIKGMGKHRVHLVVGFSADKDWQSMVTQLAKLGPSHIVCTRQVLDPTRLVVNPTQIAARFRRLCPSARVTVQLHPMEAYVEARHTLQSRDILLVTGSLFVSGHLRPQLTK